MTPPKDIWKLQNKYIYVFKGNTWQFIYKRYYFSAELEFQRTRKCAYDDPLALPMHSLDNSYVNRSLAPPFSFSCFRSRLKSKTPYMEGNIPNSWMVGVIRPTLHTRRVVDQTNSRTFFDSLPKGEKKLRGTKVRWATVVT